MSSVIPTPEGVGFKFGDATEGQVPNSIQNVVDLETMLVAYTDNEGKQKTSIVFRIPGIKNPVLGTFVLNPKVGGQWIATKTYPWFAKALDSMLTENEEPESV